MGHDRGAPKVPNHFPPGKMSSCFLGVLEGSCASTGLCVDVSSGVMIGPYRPIRISRENNLIKIDLPGGSTK